MSAPARFARLALFGAALVLLAWLAWGCGPTVERQGPAPAQDGAEDSPPARDAGAGGSGGQGPQDGGCEPWADCACDDGDPCTLDTHPPGRCEHTQVCDAGACVKDGLPVPCEDGGAA